MTVDVIDEDVDVLMSEISLKLVNELLGRPTETVHPVEFIAEQLSGATESQRSEIADCVCDCVALASVVKEALSDGKTLDHEETQDLIDMLGEIDRDARDVIRSFAA